MYLVTTIIIGSRTKENVTFTCEFYKQYGDSYNFMFGSGMCVWWQSIDVKLIKSIEKV